MSVPVAVGEVDRDSSRPTALASAGHPADRRGTSLSMDAKPAGGTSVPVSAYLQQLFHRGRAEVWGCSRGLARSEAGREMSPVSSRRGRSSVALISQVSYRLLFRSAYWRARQQC
jgi:hypothetical protein